MKIDFVHNINVDTCFLGRNKLRPSDVVKLYPGLHFQQQYVMQNLRHVCDLFELSECTILADVVQYFHDNGIKFDPALVYRDVNNSVQAVHKFKLHEEIRKDIAKFVEPKPDLGRLLGNLRSLGKQTFLLTNNIYRNVDYLFQYIIPDLPSGYNSWTELFDVVMVNADKPNFFTSEDRPFRQLNPNGDGLLWTPVTELVRGEIYRDGCLHETMKITKWGRRNILYMGDHIRNDLIDAVKHWGWRTCAIIKELDEAIHCHNSLEYRTLLSHYEQLQNLRQRTFRAGYCAKHLLKRIDSDLVRLMRELTFIRHHNFGCVFKSQSKETPIAYQLLRFADLYTSRVENLLQQPQIKFSPRRRLM